MNLTEFISETSECTEGQYLVQKFLHFIGQYGFNQFVMSDMSHDSTNQKEKNHGLLVNYPKEWMEHYVSNHYVEHDPVYQNALVSRVPFTWESATYNPRTSKIGEKVMHEAQEFKLHEGIAFSIHQPLGQIIGMGLSGSEKGVDNNLIVTRIVYAAANHFFLSYSELSGWDNSLKSKPELTDREREVLFWLARGKNRSDIADICVISESSVNRHCEKAFLKLNVSSSTLAVAKAIRMGLISPF